MDPIAAARAAGWAALSMILLAAPAAGQSVAEFYKGQTVRIVNWAAAGGEYDIHGRLISRHLGRHLPGNPSVIHQTMTGGGGLVAANHLYNAAPKDGTAMGIMVSSLPLFQALGDDAIRFDAAKFHWIGTIAPTAENLVAWHTAPAQSFEDLRKHEFVMGATGKSSPSYMVPKLMNALLDTKIKVVLGYPGGSEINLAMERGESMGRWNTWSSWKVTKPDWLQEKKIAILVQSALTKPADLPGPPLLSELAKNADDRRMFELIGTVAELGRPLVTTPDVPADRLAAILGAYKAMTTDPAFVTEAGELKVEIQPLIGDQLQNMVAQAVATPKPLAERLKKLID